MSAVKGWRIPGNPMLFTEKPGCSHAEFKVIVLSGDDAERWEHDRDLSDQLTMLEAKP